MKKAKRPRSILFRIVIACLAILLAGFCVLEAIIITGGRSSKDQSGDVLIVLGAQVYHSGPSPVLKRRLQAALDYTPTDYYYFIADRDGNFYYARTLEEHEANIRAAGISGVHGLDVPAE